MLGLIPTDCLSIPSQSQPRGLVHFCQMCQTNQMLQKTFFFCHLFPLSKKTLIAEKTLICFKQFRPVTPPSFLCKGCNLQNNFNLMRTCFQFILFALSTFPWVSDAENKTISLLSPLHIFFVREVAKQL